MREAVRGNGPVDKTGTAPRADFHKLHVSETCSAPGQADPAGTTPRRPERPQRPNLITNVATTDATVPDSKALDPIHQSLQRRGLLPAAHYLDSGYPSAELIVGSRKTYGIALITPVLLNHSRQAKAQQGFATHDFTIDWETEQATCPAGKSSVTWNPVTQAGVPKTVVSFAAADCIPCPFKDQCTSAKNNRRKISLHPRELAQALDQARAEQQTKDWQQDYALRAGVEGTIRQATAVTGIRRAPLPRPGQDPPRPRLLRRRPQPHTTRRLVERPPPRPNPHQPPRPPRTRPRCMTIKN